MTTGASTSPASTSGSTPAPHRVSTRSERDPPPSPETEVHLAEVLAEEGVCRSRRPASARPLQAATPGCPGRPSSTPAPQPKPAGPGRLAHLAPRSARPLPGAHGSGRLFSGTLIAE